MDIRIIVDDDEAQKARQDARRLFVSALKRAGREDLVSQELLDKWYGPEVVGS